MDKQWQRGVRDALKSSIGEAMQAIRWGLVLLGREGSHYGILLYWNFIVSLTGYCEGFYRILLFTILLLFTYFVSIEIGKAKSAIQIVLKSMRLTLSYSVCIAMSTPCDTNTFPHTSTRIHLFQLKIHNIWMEFLWNQKFFHLCIKKYFNPWKSYKLLLIKLFTDTSDYFQTFLQVLVFLFLTDFQM